MKKITIYDVCDFLKKGGVTFCSLVRDYYEDKLNEVGEQAFSDAINVGITNTILCLYEAKVNDKEILRVVNENWGLNVQDIEERIVCVKHSAAINSVRQYLKLQCFSEDEINSYMRKNKISAVINRDKELWKLKDNPAKLLKEIERKKNEV